MATNITLKFTDDNPSGTNDNDGWRIYRIEQSDGTDPCPDTYTDGDLKGYPIPVPANLVKHTHSPNSGKGEIEWVDDTVEPGKRYYYRPSFFRNGGVNPTASGTPTTEAVYRLSTVGPIKVPSAGGLGYPYNIPSHTSGVINYADVEPIIHIKATEELGAHGRGPLSFGAELSNHAESWKALKFSNTNSSQNGRAWIDDINNKGPNGDLSPVPVITCAGNTFSAPLSQWQQAVAPDAESASGKFLHFPEGFTTFLLAGPAYRTSHLVDDGQVYPSGFSGYSAGSHPDPNGVHHHAWYYSSFNLLATNSYSYFCKPTDHYSDYSQPCRISSDFGAAGPVPITDLGYSDDETGRFNYMVDEMGTHSRNSAVAARRYTHSMYSTGGYFGNLLPRGKFSFPGRGLGEPRKIASEIGSFFQAGNDDNPDNNTKSLHLICIHIGPDFQQTIWVNGGAPVGSFGPYPQSTATGWTDPADTRQTIAPWAGVYNAVGLGFMFAALRVGEMLAFPKALSSPDIQRVSDYLLNTDYNGHCATVSSYSGIPTY